MKLELTRNELKQTLKNGIEGNIPEDAFIIDHLIEVVD